VSCRQDVRAPYDVREVIARIVDGSEFDEFKKLYGRRWCAASRISGACRSPSSPITACCSPKARSRARTSSNFACQRNIPLVFLQNISGFMVGRKYEAGGIAKRRRQAGDGGRDRGVPKFTVVIGGSFGAGNYGMCGRAYNPALSVDLAERAHLGDGRRAGRHRAQPPCAAMLSRPKARRGRRGRGGVQGADPRAVRSEGHPYYATARLWDDGVIDPAQTRDVLGLGLSAAANAERPASQRHLRRVQDVTMMASAPYRSAAHRQSRRDRLPRHPHRAPRSACAPSRSIPKPTPIRRCMCAMADEAVHIGPAPARE
jgi:3-methylcrotonyl-CoA carboxylase beta subunit